jgi:type VI secretion system protein ImpJ
VGSVKESMKQLQPVLWTKGTFLTPQHLQVQDRFVEDSLNFRLQALKFCPWGFTSITIDQERLADGDFLLSKAAGIFPDGLLFDLPDTDPAPPSKALGEFFDPGTKSIDLYLTVPDYRIRGLNISSAKRDVNSRYVAEVSPFRDENDGVTEKPIQVARKNLRLLAGTEPRQGCSALRLARVEKTEAGTFRLDNRFVPPLLSIGASDYLTGILRGVVEILSARSTQLSSNRRQKNQSLADFTASDIADFWLLYTVNSHFPLFNHLFSRGNSHPEELYAAMVSLAGSLTTFSQKLHPRDLPLYDHDQLGPVFAELEEKLRSLLETVVPTNVVSLRLQSVKNFIYATALSDEKYFSNTRMFLALSADAKEEEIISKAPQLLKVCSATQVEHLINQALPGVQIQHIPHPPSTIPVKLKYQYFSVNQAGGAWDYVRRARNFAVFVPGEIPNPELELIVVLTPSK